MAEVATITVKIKCRECETYFVVWGLPIRGQDHHMTTWAMDWTEMDVHLYSSWKKWFHHCPDCGGLLDYYEGRPDPTQVAQR